MNVTTDGPGGEAPEVPRSPLRRLLRLGVIVGMALALGWACNSMVRSTFFGPGFPAGATEGLSAEGSGAGVVRTVATGLDTPWELAFLPDGDLLVTERGGTLVRLTPLGAEYQVADRWSVEGVEETGEAGLMGMALHPDFGDNRLLYLCFTTGEAGALVNRVVRYRLGAAGLSNQQVMVDRMPGAAFHDGCRMELGPDGMLWVTMGDAGNGGAAQDLDSFSGKILRITPDGAIPDDNPYESPVWSWGHRNPQGLAWDDRGRLWSTEHGPSGVGSGYDELNLVERNANYGWPVIRGNERSGDMRTPELHSGADDTWAPAGLAHLEGSLFFGGLRGQALYEVPLEGSGVGRLTVHFFQEFGRIRAVRAGPEGDLWFLTSNRDGRGRPDGDDDRLVRVEGSAFR